jgi:hypothetical protein
MIIPGNTELSQQHQRVERVAVLAEAVLDEAVISRVTHRGVQVAVQSDAPTVMIDLVLVALPPGNRDRDVDVHGVVSFSSTDGA